MSLRRDDRGGNVHLYKRMDRSKNVIPRSLDKVISKVNDKIVLFHSPENDYIESRGGQLYCLFLFGILLSSLRKK